MHGEVIEVERLTPSLVRVVLGGPGLDGCQPTPYTDQYVNALFVPDGAPYAAPFDLDAAREVAPEHRPKGRRYTIRWWAPASRTLAIDFVVHGDVGYAGRWAANARPGDLLQFVGPSGGYAPDPAAPWYLMVGDESALPAIAASLDVLPAGAIAYVVAVVDDARCELSLDSPADVRVTWLHRHAASGLTPDTLVAAIRALDLPDGQPDVFVHGEAAEIRAVRTFLVAERGVPREQSSISPYWRRGDTDEAWRAVKREWVTEMLAEA
ncbi:MAG TPA: siderophore-interacting protein [Ilumatobacter sp.]|nr:siderophore-interacting protein [Ilumatobacter sp.]